MPTNQFIIAFKIAAALNISVSHAAVTFAEPADVPVRAVSTGKDAKITDLNGMEGGYLALHFVTRTQSAECDAFVRGVIAGAPTLAGVRHVFLRNDPEAEVKAWSMGFGDAASNFYADEGGKLAAEFALGADVDIQGVKSNPPATVVLNANGKVVLTIVGTHAHDHPKWDTLVLRIERSRLVKTGEYNLEKKNTLAVQGYDVVAYHDGKAREGSKQLAVAYRGVVYRFADEKNRARFNVNPEKYAPTYGGWCASAMGAKGTKVEIDPTNFKIKDGRLFLFYKGFFSDALTDWNAHEAEWEPAADQSWKKFSGEATGTAKADRVK